jgi:hypothetical protein
MSLGRNHAQGASNTPYLRPVDNGLWDLSPVISVLGAVSAASTVAGLSVAGHWLLHQRDSLGRPRRFPVWSVILLAVVAIATAVPGVRRHAQESQLSRVATALVGHRVVVRCQSFGQALVDTGAELGYVAYGPDGPEPKTLIKREACADLRRYADGHQRELGRGALVAVHVLTHEAMHMRGQTNEARAECEAMQRDARTAELLGATAGQAHELARRYWQQIYPTMPSEYRTRDCAPGGPADERLPSPPW